MGKNTGIYKALLELKEEEVKSLINEKIKSGIRVEDIIKELQSGLIEVGKKFEKGEYFIPELIFAGAIMKNSMNIVKPLLKNIKVKKRGKIIMGTVYGDVHDIGKDIVILLLEGAGFEVIDLGADVEPKKFIEAIKESEAKLIGLSALLTMSFSAIEETVQVIEDSGL
ncbi:MAG: cobalamin B12-binding domain-containing protein, partial [Actinobacteria bacterium]|nr:cobalamin B12-binding domain-containing protein [Actinomycetota bacterium]